MTLQEAKDRASSIVSPNSDLFQPIVYALLDAAGEPEEGATVCSHCGRAPNGDSPDHIMFLYCKHGICDECEYSANKKHPEVQWPAVWCPVCNAQVNSNYARCQ